MDFSYYIFAFFVFCADRAHRAYGKRKIKTADAKSEKDGKRKREKAFQALPKP